MPKRVIHATETPLYIKPEWGDVHVIAKVADLVVHLPDTTKCRRGMRVCLSVETLSSSVGASLSPVSADKIVTKGLSGTDGKDLINTAATDALGDTAEVVADGVEGWRTVGLYGTWAVEA